MKFSAGEKLIITMLIDIYRHLKISGEIDPEKVAKAILGGHSWAIPQEYQILASEEDDATDVEETYEILEMWRDIDDAIKSLNKKQLVDLEKSVGAGRFKFEGFDGNNDKHQFIAAFIVNDLGQFSERKPMLNSHSRASLPRYRRMLAEFKKIEPDMDDLSLENLLSIFSS